MMKLLFLKEISNSRERNIVVQVIRRSLISREGDGGKVSSVEGRRNPKGQDLNRSVSVVVLTALGIVQGKPHVVRDSVNGVMISKIVSIKKMCVIIVLNQVTWLQGALIYRVRDPVVHFLDQRNRPLYGLR